MSSCRSGATVQGHDRAHRETGVPTDGQTDNVIAQRKICPTERGPHTNAQCHGRGNTCSGTRYSHARIRFCHDNVLERRLDLLEHVLQLEREGLARPHGALLATTLAAIMLRWQENSWERGRSRKCVVCIQLASPHLNHNPFKPSIFGTTVIRTMTARRIVY